MNEREVRHQKKYSSERPRCTWSQLCSPDYYHWICCCIYPKKKKDGLTILSQADLEDGFGNIRYDVFKTTYASFWVELVHFWLEEEKPQIRLYDLLFFSLDALNTGSISKEVIHLLFMIRFMALSGFEPHIESCGRCKTLVDDIEQNKVMFDFKEGRIICQNCAKGESKHGRMVSKGTLKQLFWINKNDVNRVDRIKFSGLAIKEGEGLLESFIPFHIGREFKSLQFLKRLRQEKWIWIKKRIEIKRSFIKRFLDKPNIKYNDSNDVFR